MKEKGGEVDEQWKPWFARLHDVLGAGRRCVAYGFANHPFAMGAGGAAIALAMAGLTFVTLYAGRNEALEHA